MRRGDRSPPSDDDYDHDYRRSRDRLNRERDYDYDDRSRKRPREPEYNNNRMGFDREREYYREREQPQQPQHFRDPEYLRDREIRDRRERWERPPERDYREREWDPRGSERSWERGRPQSPGRDRDDFGRDFRARDLSPPQKRRRNWEPPSSQFPPDPRAFPQPTFSTQPLPLKPPFRPQGRGDAFPPESSSFAPVPLPVPASAPFNPFASRTLLADPNADYLLSFKQFLDTQDPEIDPEEASKRYASYKNEHTSKQLLKFFEAHKTEEWFIEKYHPKLKGKRDEEKFKASKDALSTFTEEYRQGKFATLNLDDSVVNTLSKEEFAKEAQSEKSPEPDDEDLEDGEAQAGPEGRKCVLFIKSVPPNIRRSQIIELCQKVSGFLRLELSEPNALKKFHRVGWATYSESTSITEALKELNNTKIDSFEFHFGVYRGSSTKNLKIPPVSSTEERVKKDLIQIRKLVGVLDKEKKIEGPIRLDSDLSLMSPQEMKRALDILIVYLRKVHFFDYYSALEFETEDALLRKNGSMPVRTRSAEVIPDDNWEKNLDQKIDSRIRVTIDEEVSKKLGKKDAEGEVEKYVQGKVIQVEESKFKCDLCPKLFKGRDFVTKHIRTKHEEKIQEIEDDIAFFNNYVQDPNHMLPIPPPAPTLPSALANSNAILANTVTQLARSFQTSSSAPGLPLRPPRGLGAPLPLPGPRGSYPSGFEPQFGIPGPGGFRSRTLYNTPRSLPPPGGRVGARNDQGPESDPRPLRSYSDLDDPPEQAKLLDYRKEDN